MHEISLLCLHMKPLNYHLLLIVLEGIKYMVYHTQFHCAHTELKKFLSKVFMVIDGTIDVTSVNRNCNLNKALDYAIHQLVFSVAMEYL